MATTLLDAHLSKLGSQVVDEFWLPEAALMQDAGRSPDHLGHHHPLDAAIGDWSDATSDLRPHQETGLGESSPGFSYPVRHDGFILVYPARSWLRRCFTPLPRQVREIIEDKLFRYRLGGKLAGFPTSLSTSLNCKVNLFSGSQLGANQWTVPLPWTCSPPSSVGFK
jgi:hypothetical protein